MESVHGKGYTYFRILESHIHPLQSHVTLLGVLLLKLLLVEPEKVEF